MAQQTTKAQYHSPQPNQARKNPSQNMPRIIPSSAARKGIAGKPLGDLSEAETNAVKERAEAPFLPFGKSNHHAEEPKATRQFKPNRRRRRQPNLLVDEGEPSTNFDDGISPNISPCEPQEICQRCRSLEDEQIELKREHELEILALKSQHETELRQRDRLLEKLECRQSAATVRLRAIVPNDSGSESSQLDVLLGRVEKLVNSHTHKIAQLEETIQQTQLQLKQEKDRAREQSEKIEELEKNHERAELELEEQKQLVARLQSKKRSSLSHYESPGGNSTGSHVVECEDPHESFSTPHKKRRREECVDTGKGPAASPPAPNEGEESAAAASVLMTLGSPSPAKPVSRKSVRRASRAHLSASSVSVLNSLSQPTKRAGTMTLKPPLSRPVRACRSNSTASSSTISSPQRAVVTKINNGTLHKTKKMPATNIVTRATRAHVKFHANLHVHSPKTSRRRKNRDPPAAPKPVQEADLSSESSVCSI